MLQKVLMKIVNHLKRRGQIRIPIANKGRFAWERMQDATPDGLGLATITVQLQHLTTIRVASTQILQQGSGTVRAPIVYQ